MEHDNLLFKDEVYKIQGAVFDVFREMGVGYVEPVYQECLEIELKKRGIPFLSQATIYMEYKGIQLKQTYKPDLICYDKIIV
jgi:GxxExxY protein